MKINDKNHITIQGWMRTNLGLKGNDLLVFAVIYSFSQDEESVYNGSLQYLADWCGATKQGILNNIKNLLDKNLIIKEEKYKGVVRYCTYSTNFNTIKLSLTPIKLSLTNNINNNIINNTKVLLDNTNAIEQDKPKKKNLYEKCLDVIVEEYPSIDETFNNTLHEYLKLRLSMKDKPLYGVGQWKGLIKKLKTMSGNPNDIVQQSINNGWATFVEPQTKSYKRDLFGEQDKVVSNKMSEQDIERINNNESIGTY